MPLPAATKPIPYLTTSALADDEASSFDTALVNSQEFCRLHAILTYLTDNLGYRQEILRALIEAEFGVDQISKMKRRDFGHAMEFLNDLRFDEMRSKR